MGEFFRRLRFLVQRGRLERELADEMEFHREMAAGADGSPFGNTLLLREQARDAWGWTWLDRLFQDLRYALRILWRSPGFTLSAVLILGVGIGANVAAFGFFNLMVLRALPVRDPATLVRFQRQAPNAYASVLPYPEMAFFREHTRTLSAVLAWTPGSLTIGTEAKPVRTRFVTANLFDELGVRPILGRLLDPVRDDDPSAEPVVVVSRGFWERHFGADPAIAGKVVRLNGKPAVVVGVAANGSADLSLEEADVWLPIARQPYFVEGSRLLTEYDVEATGVTVWGRLRPGVTPAMAEADLRSLAAVLREAHPKEIWDNESVPAQAGAYARNAINYGHNGTGVKEESPLLPVAALAGTLVLLILTVACTNLGSLLLSRGLAREREMSIRASVGASQGRLIRQLFTESLLLGALGSLTGVAIGYVVLRFLMTMAKAPAWLDPSPDWRVSLFAAAAGLLSVVVFGLAPAFQLVRHRHRASVIRQLLVAAQVTAGCILLIVAGLLARVLIFAAGNPGFAYQHVVAVHPHLADHGYTPARAREYLTRLEARLHELPAVEAVSFTDAPPYGRRTTTIGTTLDGRVLHAHVANIGARYFETLQIPLLRGRGVMSQDPRGIVVSRSFAAVQWPGREPLGKTFPLGDLKYVVVGIAADARLTSDGETNLLYAAATQANMPSMVMLVRTRNAPQSTLHDLVRLTRERDPHIAADILTVESSMGASLDSKKNSVLSVSLLAGVALFLACLGIMGLVAYTVSQRTKEIAIRTSLGANPADILKVVLHQLSWPVLTGLVSGLAGAAAVSRLLRGVLFGVGQLDPIAYLGAMVLFTVATALACLGPANRALHIDPARVLRND